jgi:hypothetical protein
MPKKRLSELSLRGRHLLLIKTRAFLRGNAANISTNLVIRQRCDATGQIGTCTAYQRGYIGCMIYRVSDTTKGSNP